MELYNFDDFIVFFYTLILWSSASVVECEHVNTGQDVVWYEKMHYWTL